MRRYALIHYALMTAIAGAAMMTSFASAQPPGGFGRGQGGFGQRGRGQGQPDNLPSTPTAVELPKLSSRVTGPGPMFDSAPSQIPGMGLDHFNYETQEYFVSGMADGRPYTTRVVIRRPARDSNLSGLALAESMHSSGAAHAFEFTAAYVMDSGHIAVEILTTSPQQFKDFNAERYADLDVSNGQANDILAQVGALIKSDKGPLGRNRIRKMVLSGSSMSSGTLINYLPAHMVYRTPDMKHIYDGFMPTSAGQNIMGVDVPLIQLPTMREAEGGVPTRQDSDEPGQQYRLYEIAGVGHVDSRDNVRLHPNPCERPLSMFPTQAYMAVGLYHLMRWVDEGIVPPRADRYLLDQDTDNDGSMLALDERGNPQGGIRNPYVDVPTARYVAMNTAKEPLIANPAPWITANGGLQGANIMCTLSNWQESFSAETLRELYGSPENYRRMVAARLDALEKEGWSLPLYHDLIMADAAAVDF